MPFPPPTLLRFLDRTRLAPPLFRLYESISSLWPSGEIPAGSGPLPPVLLRVKVAGTPLAFNYIDGGRKAVHSIDGILRAAGSSLDAQTSILEFGCGCGRVLSCLDRNNAIAGCDLNPDLIAWVNRRLPEIDARVNGLEPPLPWMDGSFDLVFALSVFTHLPEPIAVRWMAELSRVLKPGGYLAISTHGEHYSGVLSPTERAVFAAGRIVERFVGSAGSNLCNTYTPESYVRNVLGAGMRCAAFRARGALGNPEQDLYLFQKPMIEI
ncbi:MAG: methyltransferase domain-containing protein [Bryobacteraceae bacterium]|nr:methyltransferase domain-containing protein [Bryobacteraceae bacterium]